jgi:hypothetical protein
LYAHINVLKEHVASIFRAELCSGMRLYIQNANTIVVQIHGCRRRKGNQSRPVSAVSKKMALFWATILSFIT